MNISAVILAAGQGTRMRSSMPKVLHPLLGSPMLLYSLEAARLVTGTTPVLVIGHGGEKVKQAIGGAAHYALQEPQLGTAHALMQAEPLLRGKADLVLLTAADMPLITPETLSKLVQAQAAHAGPITLLSGRADTASDFGRVLRGPDGRMIRVHWIADGHFVCLCAS